MKHSLFPSTEENPKNYPKFAQKPPRIIPSLLSKPPELSQVCFQDTQKRGGKGTCVLAFCTVAGLRLELVLSAHPFKQLGEGCGLSVQACCQCCWQLFAAQLTTLPAKELACPLPLPTCNPPPTHHHMGGGGVAFKGLIVHDQTSGDEWGQVNIDLKTKT